MFRFLFLVLTLIPVFGFSKTGIYKNIPYQGVIGRTSKSLSNTLDIYCPKSQSGKSPVLIFIHGGSWNSGNKNTYRYLGKRLAKKGITAVIINYRLTPEVNYLAMSNDCASAVKWVYRHVEEYGGDSSSIFVSGHSAGGHLAALLSNDPYYFKNQGIDNPLKGCILIDAFGLNMYDYFQTSNYSKDVWFKKTFTNNPETWKNASPQYHIAETSIPQLIWIGGKTYPSIKIQNNGYYKTLSELNKPAWFEIIKGKGHIRMISQFIWTSNPQYKKIVRFVADPTKYE